MSNTLRFFGWPCVVGVLLALLIIQRYPHWVGLSDSSLLGTSAQSAPHSYANAVNGAAPAVANLYTTKAVDKPRNPSLEEQLLQRFYGDNPPHQQRIQSSLGSAVIMTPSGYLLTNNHVTANAEQIVVALKDGRETFARVIGSDPETDLAVLKIDLENLPAISLGQSDNIHIGDVTLAIGNPFGVGQTVTMGIISATGRNQLGLNTYEDFIQTDAAINRGNSGGALVDANGNLIGINTAIISESGGSQGIGFAIPIKLALEVMKSIIAHGEVIRGWLGVEVSSMPAEMAEAYKRAGYHGILVHSVYLDGPADQTGLRSGDLILSIDGEPAADGRSSMNQVARTRPGKRIDIRILRNGQPLTLQAAVGQRPTQVEVNP
ncbi:S1C family serine protease [Stutzerimonas kirkiae]|uniref:2-alkenal reductase n=1 Tax=Stutzerimonas kirkiae TaxID=2211392 RepID=A0A4Q9RD31_9GAMM|nr:trypsin-like peptidase domain-containing protein [Stutzerimonas kirkiae]TBU98926.1 2-alkenal reductase [Stutzerimonas kirkiae]TBV01576.1 2-alkenal reductase [Stutzerimonas kirkiae]TBV10320.1 2-alkenal reductase [Stutzerimonas kirkiae]TBV16887.1 2-alkenal reductase [Stutzerimonas kirkiae]